mgnify:CR=1 FL=1
MKTMDRGEETVICLEGRIDSNNAPDVEKEITGILHNLKNNRVSFDVEELSYISSAGLRVLMKIRKQLGYPIEIRNASRDLYDIFETTGFTELFTVKKAYRSITVDGMEVIGRGFFGTVYRIDEETIVKVYQGEDSIPMIENEKRMAQKAFLSGIPTAISYDIVKVGDNYGSVFELLNARSLNELVQSGEMPLKDIVTKYIDLLKQVHGITLPYGEFPSYRERYLDYLNVIAGYLTDAQTQKIRELLTDMPEEHTVVHGDVQMKNVMLVNKEPMLIDMDTLGLGNPVFELAGPYVTYKLFEEDEPGNSMKFLGLPKERVDELWDLIIDTYFDFRDAEEKRAITDRIALVGAIRFLYLIVTTDLKNSELGRKRIAHAASHIEELLKTVTMLSI